MFRFTGRIVDLDDAERHALFDRGTSADDTVRAATDTIIRRVRADGDAALVALARELDGVAIDVFEVSMDECRAALDSLDPALRSALERSAANIARAHAAWLPRASEVETEPGVVVGRRPDPLTRVGVYTPGGRASYPSSLLMAAVPARVAGVGEIIVCTPPGPDGRPAPVVLAAAAIAGVDRMFALGGAGAIAAMAYGTRNVPRVDRIVGPGNAYVAEAKLQVSGVVGIDSPAGPSELLVIADDSADPDVVAREMLAQAEHDPRAAVVAIGIGVAVAGGIEAAVARALPSTERFEIASQALADRGGVVVAGSHGEAVAFAAEYAPEHLLLALSEPALGDTLASVRNAGTVFVGQESSVAFGDYMTGANHVLPTGGLARSYSGLSTLDFFRWTTYQRVTRAAAEAMANDVARLAEAEGLPAHAAAVRVWEAANGTHQQGAANAGRGRANTEVAR
jgi:histidinol dehydrogenase